MIDTTYLVGIMSGTSMDGVDTAMIAFSNQHSAGRLVECRFDAYPNALRQDLRALLSEGSNELHRAAQLGITLAEQYAASVRQLVADCGIQPSAIACHGQTVRHRPDNGYSVQLLNPATLAELTGTVVICDFRSRDIAAGGQGAPLVPAFHAKAFRHPQKNRVIVNIGGIANLTWLPASGTIEGFDCGPGNLLLDHWCQQHTGHAFDRDGAWGAQGSVLPKLLARLLAHPYFYQSPPKSAGYEQFNPSWLTQQLQGNEQAQDVQATLVALTAHGITNAILQRYPTAHEVYLCGGGAHNHALSRLIAQQLPQQTVDDTGRLGISPDWLEAHAFAWLGWQTLQGQPGNQPEVTGARHTCVLGAIYPA